MSDLIIIKASENGVSVILTNKDVTELRHPERLDKGEVLILPAPENGQSYNVRGRAQVFTQDHVLEAESSIVIGGSLKD